jgi:hypothetical protein
VALNEVKRFSAPRKGESAEALLVLGRADPGDDAEVTVAVTRPAIAVLPERGLPRGVFVGRRLPRGFESLSAAAKKAGIDCEIHSQPRGSNVYPARLSLLADSFDDLATFAKAQGLDCAEIPAAWSILHLAGSLDDYSRTLTPEDLSSLNWDREDFDHKALSFSRLPQQDVVVLSRYTHPSRRTMFHVLNQIGTTARVEPEWGRFAVMSAMAHNVLIYDSRACALAVPITMPLPKLLARSLCLCSGFMPLEMDGIDWPGSGVKARVYTRVPLSIAYIVTAKLKQQLTFHGFFDAALTKAQNG